MVHMKGSIFRCNLVNKFRKKGWDSNRNVGLVFLDVFSVSLVCTGDQTASPHSKRNCKGWKKHEKEIKIHSCFHGH